MLVVEDLRAEVDGREVLRGVSLSLEPGKVVALVGPNGSGKSSLARVIMGDPRFRIISGRVILEGEDITDLPPEERARRGLFLAFQSPPDLDVPLSRLLLAASGREDPRAFSEMVDAARRVGLDPAYLSRPANKGFSGGERKRSEVLQAIFLGRRYIIFDEVDSGLDVEGQRRMAEIIRDLASAGRAILLISHNPAFVRLVSPVRVHVMENGRIVKSGGTEVLRGLELD